MAIALDRTGYFVHPTVLAQVTSEMRLYQEEIFGLVVAVTPFHHDDEVVAMANDTTRTASRPRPGQRTSLVHTDLAKRDPNASTVTLNCQMDAGIPRRPSGGFKQSGWGYENGQDGIEGYLKTKTVLAQL